MPEGLEGLLAGRTLVGRYEIEEVIGRGGFAVVYRANDRRLARPVAVKVITLTAGDAEGRERQRRRLHREARAAAGLPHHPNLVAVHDVGTDPELGLDFLVMELLQGENLAQYLAREGKPELGAALRVLRAAATGIAVGHRAGLVHGDVKPANLFLARGHDAAPAKQRVCVLDYGIARGVEEDVTRTRGEASPLSPAFASPEQLRGEMELSPAADVFSLGVVGYQLLTGERPFSPAPGAAPAGWTLRRGVRELAPAVPPGVEAVLLRALRVEPAERYADADAFARALDEAEADADATLAAPLPSSTPPPLSGLAGTPPRRSATARWAALAVGGALVAGAAWMAHSARGPVSAPAALEGSFPAAVEPSPEADDLPTSAPEPSPAPPPADTAGPDEERAAATPREEGTLPADTAVEAAVEPEPSSPPSPRPTPPGRERGRGPPRPFDPDTPERGPPVEVPEPPRPVVVQPTTGPPDTVRITPPE